MLNKVRMVVMMLALSSTNCMTSTMVTVGCDWNKTRVNTRRYDTRYELNPVLGETPTSQAVDLYFMGVVGAIIGAHYLLPEKYLPAMHGLITGVQVKVAYSSYHKFGEICGL